MTPAELKEIRTLMRCTQSAMADLVGLSLRGYEELEAGRTEIRRIHENAVKWAQMLTGFNFGKFELLPQEAQSLILDFRDTAPRAEWIK